MANVARGRFFKRDGNPITRRLKIERLTANTSVVLPAYSALRRIYFFNHTANAVTGGIRIGTSAAGTQVVTAQAIAANALVEITPTINALGQVDSTLYIETVTAWNNAAVSIVISYEEVDPRL